MSRPTMTRGRPPGAGAPEDTAAGPTAQLSGQRRFALRARAVRRASRWWKLGVPLLVLVVAAGAWLVWSGPVLVVRSVAVPGVPAAQAADIRAAARVPVGQPMVRLDLGAARRRVAALPTVREVSVSRSWPTGVTIDVTLRTPVAVVKDASGRLHLADSTGTTYAEVSSAPPGLPLVDADAANAAAVQSVVAVLAGLPPGLRGQVGSAKAQSPDAVVLTIGRTTVVWGSAAETALKATVLQALRKANPTARQFDLSAPRSPSVG